MIDYVVYGKIIIDDIVVGEEIVRSVLGGGGPQAAFGARLWSDSVGFLSRSGSDLAVAHRAALRELAIDLSGWRQFPAIPTPRTLMRYDAEERLTGGLLTSHEDWTRLLNEPLTLPSVYQRPRAIHLVTEFPDEPVVQTALQLRALGTLFSLEPLPFGPSEPSGFERMLALIGQSDVVTPDWPTASALAKSVDPVRVIRCWSRLGPKLVAIRHGARGSYLWSRERDEAWHVPAVPTRVVDPTGAGNAYGGGLCVGWTETGDARHAGCYGAIAAAMLIRQVGFPPLSPALRQEAADLLTPALAAASRL
jgi:sugar/nucleoside kinase (ribokinase family)